MFMRRVQLNRFGHTLSGNCLAIRPSATVRGDELRIGAPEGGSSSESCSFIDMLGRFRSWRVDMINFAQAQQLISVWCVYEVKIDPEAD